MMPESISAMKSGNLGATVIATFAERTSAAGARGKYRKTAARRSLVTAVNKRQNLGCRDRALFQHGSPPTSGLQWH